MFPIPFNFPFRKKDGSMTTISQAISEGGGSYTLPTASATTKGGVKVGEGLTMDGETLKNTNPTPPTPYVLPTASDETLGGVKVGSGLSIDDGVLSASGGGNTLYKHNIILHSSSVSISFTEITKDPTPFTMQTLETFLSNDFKGLYTAHPATCLPQTFNTSMPRYGVAFYIDSNYIQTCWGGTQTGYAKSDFSIEDIVTTI